MHLNKSIKDLFKINASSAKESASKRFEPGYLSVLFDGSRKYRWLLYNKIKEYARLKMLQGGRLMDFGCGTKPYRHYFNVNEYIGVEYKSDNYKYDKDCVDVYYDGKTLPFEDGHFKTIYSSEVIQQINNIDEILDEFNRVLEDKGKLLITATFLYQELMSSTDTFRYTIKGLKRLLARKGFRIIKLDKLGTANETMALLIAHYLMFKTRRNPLLKFFVYYPVLAVVSLFSNISFGSNECDDMFYIGMIILAEKTGGRKR